MRSAVVKLGVLLALLAVLAAVRVPAAGVQAQMPPANGVPYPAQLTLAPGDSVTLYDATPQQPSSDPRARGFTIARASVAVSNSTSAPLDVSSDGRTLTLGGAAGVALQLHQTVQHPNASTGGSSTGSSATSAESFVFSGSSDSGGIVIAQDDSPEHLDGCLGTDPAADAVNCGIPPEPGPFVANLVLGLDVSAATGGQRSAALLPGERETLLLPADDGGDPPALELADNAAEPLHAIWDGTTLQAALPIGYMPAGFAASEATSATPRPLSLQPLAALGCVAGGPPNVIACPFSGRPPLDVSFISVLALPQSATVLPYADGTGNGTLTLTPTGSDPALGGQAVGAMLDRAGVAFSGTGVLRPWGDSGDVAIALSLTNAAGSPLLLEGTLHVGSSSVGGRGYTFAPADSALEGRWRVTGTPFTPNYELDFDAEAVGIDVVTESADGGESSEGFGQLADGSGVGPFGLAFGGSIDGAVGKADQSITLQAQFSTPDPDVTSDASYIFDFGDGSPLTTVQTDNTFPGAPLGQSENVTHTYAQPGAYRVIVYRDDDTGVRTFGVVRLHIAPAGS